MATEIRNDLGKIVMQDEVIAMIAGYAASENYGIVGMNPQKASEMVGDLMKRDNLKKGIVITNITPSEVDINLHVTLEYGVSLPAVADNARHNVRYRVQEYTGIAVRNVNIFVDAIRV